MLLRKQAQNKFLDVKTENFTFCNKITSNLILEFYFPEILTYLLKLV